MKKVIVALLALSAFGVLSSPASADSPKKEAEVQGDTAIIQSVDMTVDQYGEGNTAIQQGTIRNRSNREAGGSTGVVQSGTVHTIQTGSDNMGRSKFRIENETGTGSRHRR